ncbi:MAG: O-antigen ligase family protein [Ornithinibacter sp.]
MRWLLDRLGWPERAALTLLALFVGWSWVASVLGGRMPSLTSPYVLSPVVLAAGVALGQIVATRVRTEIVVAGLIVVTTVLFLGAIWTDGPALRPTGYANANAALAVQVIGLCGLALLRADRAQRIVLWLTAAGAVGVIAANSSMAAFGVAVPLLVAVALMTWRPARHAWWAVLIGAASVAGVAIGVAHLAGQTRWPSVVLTALDAARKSLWSDALSLWEAQPVTGGGPGSLAEYSTLGSDPDTAAAHSSLLQVGAETGWIGVALFSLIILAGLLWAARGSAPYAVIGAAAWTALLVHSLTDHLIEFGPVVLAAGFTIGWAGAARTVDLGFARSNSSGPEAVTATSG